MKIIAHNFWLILILLISTPINSQNFSDITNSLSFDDVTSNNANLSRPDLYGTGASIADFDNDGDLDVFVGTQFGLTNRLYENNGSGQFQDVAVAKGIDSDYRNRAALWFDYDGDQRLDLILLGDCYRAQDCPEAVSIFLYKQMPSGSFTEVNNSNLTFGTKYNISNFTENIVAGGLAVADINNDNYLDVLVSVWGSNGVGAKLTLFLNDGDGTFSDISDTSNLGVSSFSRWQPLFHDFNDDGFIDIYINIDFTENELWINNGDNTFQEVGNTAKANNAFNEMGLAAGDYDNDGDIDVYSTNISRIETGETLPRHNILIKNNSSPSIGLNFTEVSQNLGVDESDWDWGTTFFDANNDGYLDLAATNGWVERTNWPLGPSKFWLNVDGLLFSDQSNNSGFNDNLDGTTLLAFDMERDGDLDLLQSVKQINGGFKPIRIYQNDISQAATANNYLVVKPRMGGTNNLAIGATVKMTYGTPSKTIMRLITAGISFYGQEPAEAFFGVADATIIDEIVVDWPDNTQTVVEDITANQVITVGKSGVLDIAENSLEKVKLYPNPTEDILFIEAINKIEKIEIYSILGQKVYSKLATSRNEDIDISSLKTGSYFLKLRTENNQSSQTFQIIKK